MKVAVLMSGGIDSTFVALHLKRQGFDVFGITFLQLGGKSQEKELKKAQNIAKALSMPHFVIKTKEIFEKEIISDFCKEYKRGKTPNPCPFCNKKIKFGIVLKRAEKFGAKRIATGHYARLRREIPNSKNQIPKYEIFRAKDKTKDQSYFLWQLTQKELEKTLFPLGDFTKNEIWQEINKSPLSKFFKEKNRTKGYSESQDICFLKEKSLSDLLKNKLSNRPGPILDKHKKKIGEHQGIHFFTVGQRSGIKIGAKSPKQRPLYVIDIDYKKNAIIVGKEEDLYKKELLAEKVNWISPKQFLRDATGQAGKEPKLPLLVQAQIRYRSKPAMAKVSKYSKNKLKVKFKVPQRAITPGQHIVFYKKDMLFGGGIIEKS